MIEAINEWKQQLTKAIDMALAYTLCIPNYKSIALFGDGEGALSFDNKFQLFVAADWFDFEDKAKLNMSKQLLDIAEFKKVKNWNDVV
ncbi:hypothetical protein OKW96_11790 [Sphingobacterium sp. KU25419]|nr:hypothetical protein OKW96_11790 [Sphingobacterium sp. KU25419]